MKRAMLGAALTLAVSVADAAETARESYVPGMGEIMGTAQIRHAKLWYAGKAGNWPLADYELGELKESFADAVKYHPMFKGVAVSGILDRFVDRPMDALGKAIKAQQQKPFRRAFDKLTEACNACHREAGHGFIMITRPGPSPFSNQDFAVRR